jgi:hypothetical protein
MSTDDETLARFFGSVFHQDWCVDFDSSDAVVAQFFRDHPDKKELVAIVRALRKLLAIDADEETMLARLVELDCELYPPGLGLTARAWLSDVAEKFDREITRRS